MFNQQDIRLVKAFVKVITGYSANSVYLEKINNNLPYTAPKTTIILNINIVSWNIHTFKVKLTHKGNPDR